MKREIYEELGVHIKVEHLIAKVEYKGTEYYFNADIVGGVLEVVKLKNSK